MGAAWVEDMRRVAVLEVAGALGLKSAKRSGASGGMIYGCPICSAETRHTKSRDKRGAIGIRSDGRGWKCYQCEATGDALQLVAFVLEGKRFADCGDTGKANVGTWCRHFLGIEAGNARRRTRPKRGPKPLPPRPKYLPADELAALWAACTPVTDDPGVCAWMTDERPAHGHARLDPAAIADFDAARVVPDLERLPRWAGHTYKDGHRKGQWEAFPAMGLRLAVPLYDATGAPRSLIFRRTFESDKKWPKKAMSAGGHRRKDLAMMCPLAREMFATRRVPDLCNGKAPHVYISEGDTDYLASVGYFAGEAASVGIVSGSWTDRHAARLPRGCTIVIRTDPNDAGARYAARIVRTLTARASIGEIRLRLRSEFTMITDARGRPVGVELAK